MATKLTNMYLLSAEEYKKLTNPDTTYTLLTKTSAANCVKNILKETKSKCWQDDKGYNVEIYCGECPVMKLLGTNAGMRICTRQKNWSS